MLAAYERAGASVSGAAELLGVSTPTWRRRVIAHKLDKQLQRIRKRMLRAGTARSLPGGWSKLSDADVLEIRRAWHAGEKTQQQLAAEYGVTKLTILKTVHGRRKTAAERAAEAR